MKNWIEQLLPIINEYKDGNNEPLDGDGVDDLCKIIKAKINLQEGNIVENEYNTILDGEPILYVLSEDRINGVKIHQKIIDEQLFEYEIRHRESFIEDLYSWIAEAKGNDKILMKEDLQEMLEVKDEYILSSISTNAYLYNGCSEFNENCKELLEMTHTEFKNN